MIRRSLLPLLAALVTLAAAGLSAFIWAQRQALPYNEQGRFFDADTATVLHEQSVAVFAIVAVCLTIAGAGLLTLSHRRKELGFRDGHASASISIPAAEG